MHRFEPIEAIVPRRVQGIGEPLRQKASMLRAGLPVPAGHVLARAAADDAYARCLEPSERPAVLLDPHQALPDDAVLAKLRERVTAAALDEPLREEVARVDAQLRGQGATALALTAYIVCDRPAAEQVLGKVRLRIESEAALCAGAAQAFAALLDGSTLRALRGAGVRDGSVALCVQRMVDGLVSGLVYTRHPVTGDRREWLLRAGYGLGSAIREGRVPSDVIRASRDGFVRDVAIAPKHHLEFASPSGLRQQREVPTPLVHELSLGHGAISDVLRLAERVERHEGHPVRVEWSIVEGSVYLLRVDTLPGEGRAPRGRRAWGRDRSLWSHAELGEAIPHPLTPLGWSLLRRFARDGLESALFASGVRLPAGSELVNDVRGRAYLNIGLLTEAVCRIPGVTPRALERVGLSVQPEIEFADALGPIDLARAVVRLYDAHFRFGRRMGLVSTRLAGERGHFAGLDARLLAPDAVDRVLRDVERWLFDVGTTLMRTNGVWLATLVGLRALLVRYAGEEALRLERDLLWGRDELPSVALADEFVALACTLSRDSRALAWADGDAASPSFVRDAVLDFATRHRHAGMLLLDPASSRWRETPERLEGPLRALLSDPMGLAATLDRREIARGRRERAEREWKRLVPMSLWPLGRLLIARIRELTRHRESLLADTSRSIAVVRNIAKDASRRLEMRYRDIGSDAAFYLELEELHAGLVRGQWDVEERIATRRTELRIVASLPPAEDRFFGAPSGVAPPASDLGQDLRGLAGSGGAAEGRVVRVVEGDELARLPPGAVLVVPACDVGMCAVLPTVRAVVSERGGMLSHGAMLASALGVPVVVGVEQASLRLRDGERVRVDADACRVERTGAST